MNYILYDGASRIHLLPFTFTRPVADIRVGILTLRQKWEHYLNAKTSSLTQAYLSKKFPLRVEADNILINASVFPNAEIVNQIKNLKAGEALVHDDTLVALGMHDTEIENFSENTPDGIEAKGHFMQLKHVWDIYALNQKAIEDDFKLLTTGRKSMPVSTTNFILGNPELIFIEAGAQVEYAFLNTHDGPIYVGKDAIVMEGAKIRGPFALCEHAQVKMDAKIYGATTIGPFSKVGGEVSNSVIFGYSNKGHDGFLGNSVLGEWCNLGADTNISNLKNTYEPVKLWSYAEQHFVQTGQQFCGLMMGDHSKSGINTMFNTGTVVGVNANIFGDGYQRNFIPSFSWGGKSGLTHFQLKKAFQVATAVLARRNKVFDEVEKEILSHIFELTYDSRR
jgi:UDP-N-acetylglucosamine diphosphorylase/glucosamine-1-phosphate N-acetyltransferase